jgi:dephospho-CoA kinase
MLTRIGITGGIGSGKSEVCQKFASLGIAIVSADIIAHQLTDSDPHIKRKIISLLGPETYDATSGMLRREYVAQLAFGNKGKLLTLNSIVHPEVFKAIESEIQITEKKQKAGYIVVEAALMFESGLYKEVDYVLTVVAEERLRIERTEKRGNFSEGQIRLRMANQFAVEEAIEASDFVLHNNDSIDALHKRVFFFHSIFSTLKPRVKKDHGHSR